MRRRITNACRWAAADEHRRRALHDDAVILAPSQKVADSLKAKACEAGSPSRNTSVAVAVLSIGRSTVAERSDTAKDTSLPSLVSRIRSRAEASCKGDTGMALLRLIGAMA